MRLGDDFQVLRRRDFRLLFLGQSVSVFGDRMVVVALAFAVIHLGGSESEVGLVLAGGWAPLVLTVLAGGVVADRTSRRAVMVAADLARIVSQGTMAVLLITGAAEIWMLAALAGVTGAATGLFNPASTGLLPEVVPDEELQPANALRSVAISGSEIWARRWRAFWWRPSAPAGRSPWTRRPSRSAPCASRCCAHLRASSGCVRPSSPSSGRAGWRSARADGCGPWSPVRLWGT